MSRAGNVNIFPIDSLKLNYHFIATFYSWWSSYFHSWWS